MIDFEQKKKLELNKKSEHVHQKNFVCISPISLLTLDKRATKSCYTISYNKNSLTNGRTVLPASLYWSSSLKTSFLFLSAESRGMRSESIYFLLKGKGLFLHKVTISGSSEGIHASS